MRQVASKRIDTAHNYSLIITVFCSLVLGLVINTVTYQTPTKLSSQPNSYDQVSGFPLQVQRQYGQHAIRLSLASGRGSPVALLGNVLFWVVGGVAIRALLNKPYPTRRLAFAALLALGLMLLDMQTGKYCKYGTPIKIYAQCGAGAYLNTPVWFYALLNYAFWLAVSSVGFLSLATTYASRLKLVRYLGPPLAITVLSLAYKYSCTGWFCYISSGRGYPFAYAFLANDVFVPGFFGISYVFWLVVYLTLRLLLRLVTRWYRRRQRE